MTSVALWFPLLGVFAVVVGAIVARSTARDIADLNARQKRRDVEITAVSAYSDAAITAVHAVQAYVWWADDHLLSKETITQQQWIDAKPTVKPTIEAVDRLQYLGTTLPPGELRDLHDQFADLLNRVVKPVDRGRSAKEVWDDAVDATKQPDIILRTIEAAHGLRGELLSTYPVDVPNSIGERIDAVMHPRRK